MPEISDAELRTLVAFQNLGTPNEIQKKIADLEKDNATQRDEIRTLKETVPKDGEIVVKKTDADRLEKFKQFGKPEDVEAKLQEGETAIKERDYLKRTSAARNFAKAAGLADEAVETMVAIPALEKAGFEVKTEKVKDSVTGKETEMEVAYITLPTEDGKSTETLSFDKAKEKVPALKGLRSAETEKQPDKPGLNFVPQGGGDGNGQKGTVYDRIRQERQNEKKAREEAQTDRVDPLEKQYGIKQST